MELGFGQGHAAHFLTRLDRLDRAEVELALALYNDVELLLEILRRAKIPDEAERACIALGPPEQGPFLVVTREGRFVTCLAAGMSPGRLPVVTRAQLDGFAAKMTELRARMEMSRRLSGGDALSSQLVRSVTHAGMNLSREEFVALSAWVTPLRGVFIYALMGGSRRFMDARKGWLGTTKVNRQNEPQLRELWSLAWAIAHLTALLSIDAREICEGVEAQIEPGSDRDGPSSIALITQTCAELGMTGALVRGVHWSARAGKHVLPFWKEHFRDWILPEALITAGVTLSCIGIRHQRLEAEVRKALDAHVSDAPDWAPPGAIGEAVPEFAEGLRSLVGHLRHAANVSFETPEALTATHRERGAGWAMRLLADQPATSPFRFATPADVPRDVALAMLCNMHWDPAQEQGLNAVLHMIPWLARAKAEDLYLPRDVLTALDLRFRPELVLDLLAAQRNRVAKRAPELVPKKPGRNEPCRCGSGKKYKRCCGA